MAWADYTRGAGGRFTGGKGAGGNGGNGNGGARAVKIAALRERVAAARSAVSNIQASKVKAATATRVASEKKALLRAAKVRRDAAKKAEAKAAQPPKAAAKAPAKGQRLKATAEQRKQAQAQKAQARTDAKVDRARATEAKRAERVKQIAAKKAERDKARAEAKTKKAEAAQAAKAEKLKAVAAKKAELAKAKAEAKDQKAAEREKKRQALQEARKAKEAKAKKKPEAETQQKPKQSEADSAYVVPFGKDAQKTQALHQAVESGDLSKARLMLREHIASTLPGVASRDPHSAVKVHSSAEWEVATQGRPAAALHDWDGTVRISQQTYENLKEGTGFLSSGALGTRQFTHADAGALYAVHGMIHEELHGMSRSSPGSYRKHGALLEEVGVELSARHATRRLHPSLANNAVAKDYYAPDAPGGAYRRQIERVSRVIGSHTGWDSSRVSSAIVEAHRTGPGSGKGAKFRSPDEHLDSFVRALNVTPTQASAIRAGLSQIEI